MKKQLRKDLKVRKNNRKSYGRKTPKVKKKYERLFKPGEKPESRFESEEEERLYRKALDQARDELFEDLGEFYEQAHRGEFIWDPDEEPDYDADPCSLMNLWDDL